MYMGSVLKWGRRSLLSNMETAFQVAFITPELYTNMGSDQPMTQSVHIISSAINLVCAYSQLVRSVFRDMHLRLDNDAIKA